MTQPICTTDVWIFEVYSNQGMKYLLGAFYLPSLQQWIAYSIYILPIYIYNGTPPNFWVCAQQKVPAKRFTICHILYMYLYENPKLLFPFFILCYFIFPPLNALVYVDIDFIRGKYKVARNEKWKKQLWVFI